MAERPQDRVGTEVKSRSPLSIPNAWGLEAAWFALILGPSLALAALMIGLLDRLDPEGLHVNSPSSEWSVVFLVGTFLTIVAGRYWFTSVIRPSRVCHHLARQGFQCTMTRGRLHARRGSLHVKVEMRSPFLGFSPTPGWSLRVENGASSVVRRHGFHPRHMQTKGQVEVTSLTGKQPSSSQPGHHTRARLTDFFQEHANLARVLFPEQKLEDIIDEVVMVGNEGITIRVSMGPWLGAGFLRVVDGMVRSLRPD